MKNKLMLLIVLAGISTAIYRFLPPDIQHKIDAQLHKIAHVKSAMPSAVANTPPKKYVLDIPDSSASAQSDANVSVVTSAYIQHQQDVQVRDQGRVVKVLFDDNDGSKHQRFIVRLQSGITVLIAHNIDLAPRVNALKEGDTVSFYGEYVWNEKGGIVHWTHRDPHGHHLAGWLKHNGATYQ
jgi:hypothetical protein